MTGWNFDISQAPRGNMVETTVHTVNGSRTTSRHVPARVILATKCGKVVLSHYIPDDEGRWMMLGKGEEPDAWFAWPEHPHSLPSSSQAADSPTLTPLAVSGSQSQVQP